MSQCCKPCQEALESAIVHTDLVLLSEITQSKIYKCKTCQTYMHVVFGEWEIFMQKDPLETLNQHKIH